MIGRRFGVGLGVRWLRTHERTSLQIGARIGARPAQGAATTNGVDSEEFDINY